MFKVYVKRYFSARTLICSDLRMSTPGNIEIFEYIITIKNNK